MGQEYSLVWGSQSQSGRDARSLSGVVTSFDQISLGTEQKELMANAGLQAQSYHQASLLLVPIVLFL
jgi:hypothetical protein